MSDPEETHDAHGFQLASHKIIKAAKRGGKI